MLFVDTDTQVMIMQLRSLIHTVGGEYTGKRNVEARNESTLETIMCSLTGRSVFVGIIIFMSFVSWSVSFTVQQGV